MTANSTAVDQPQTDAVSALLQPRAIAIVGASGRENNPFARPLHYLLEYGFKGQIYPINPNYTELNGLRCYPDLEALPGPVDLVLLLVPADAISAQLPQIAAAGAKAAVVFASGFGEVADGGAAKEEALVAAAAELGVRLVGPNCQGVLNLESRTVATFTPALQSGLPMEGNIAYVGQSGAVGGSILSFAIERGMGIAAWVSTGNQADLGASEIAQWLVERENIKVITFYFETLPGLDHFIAVARRAQDLGKRIVVLQSGTSGAGARAATSHTGAIIGNNASFDVICREYGVIRTSDLDEFVTVSHALSSLPQMRGRRVGVVTTSGGAGSLVADQLESVGLQVEEFSEAVQGPLRSLVPEFGSIANPVDVTAQMFRANDTAGFGEVCDVLAGHDEVDAVLVVLTLVTGEFADRMAAELIRTARRSSKPVAVLWLASASQTLDARERFRNAGFPVLQSPRLAAQSILGLATGPSRGGNREVASLPREILDELDSLAGPVHTEGELRGLLGAAGVATPQSAIVRSAIEATAFAHQVGGTVVMKIQSADVLHKTDVGGVRLGVTADKAGDVYDDLMLSFAEVDDVAVLVQQQIGAGPELIIGLTQSEENVAPLITVGIGGTATELYGDTATRLSPITADEAEALILSLRGAPLLTGFRGGATYPLRPIAEAVSMVSAIGATLADRLIDFEINPFRATPEGPIALDGLLVLETEV